MEIYTHVDTPEQQAVIETLAGLFGT